MFPAVLNFEQPSASTPAFSFGNTAVVRAFDRPYSGVTRARIIELEHVDVGLTGFLTAERPGQPAAARFARILVNSPSTAALVSQVDGAMKFIAFYDHFAGSGNARRLRTSVDDLFEITATSTDSPAVVGTSDESKEALQSLTAFVDYISSGGRPSASADLMAVMEATAKRLQAPTDPKAWADKLAAEISKLHD